MRREVNDKYDIVSYNKDEGDDVAPIVIHPNEVDFGVAAGRSADPDGSNESTNLFANLIFTGSGMGQDGKPFQGNEDDSVVAAIIIPETDVHFIMRIIQMMLAMLMSEQSMHSMMQMITDVALANKGNTFYKKMKAQTVSDMVEAGVLSAEEVDAETLEKRLADLPEPLRDLLKKLGMAGADVSVTAREDGSGGVVDVKNVDPEMLPDVLKQMQNGTAALGAVGEDGELHMLGEMDREVLQRFKKILGVSENDEGETSD